MSQDLNKKDISVCSRLCDLGCVGTLQILRRKCCDRNYRPLCSPLPPLTPHCTLVKPCELSTYCWFSSCNCLQLSLTQGGSWVRKKATMWYESFPLRLQYISINPQYVQINVLFYCYYSTDVTFYVIFLVRIHWSSVFSDCQNLQFDQKRTKKLFNNVFNVFCSAELVSMKALFLKKGKLTLLLLEEAEFPWSEVMVFF